MKNLFYLLILITFAACSNDNDVIETPNEVVLDPFFMDAKQGSFWEYVNVNYTINGAIDTFASPLNLYKMGKDSLIDGKTYEMIGQDLNAGVIAPYYIYKLEDKKLLQAHIYNPYENSEITHLEIMDFNKPLKEEWRLDLFENKYQINYMDSVNINFNGFDNVTKMVSKTYLNGSLEATLNFYVNPQIGIVGKVTDYEASGIRTVVHLVDYDVSF